jgi:hypothetical protein
MIKSQYKLTLTLSVLLALASNLPVFSASLSHSLGSTKLTNNQEILLASRWRRKNAPSWGLFGARRGSCLKDKTELFPLVPPDETLDPFGRFTYHKSVWNSTADYPTIFFYIPQDNLTKGQFILQDTEGNSVYSVSLQFPPQAGVISVKLPQFSPKGTAFPPLEVGQSYRWIISIECEGDVNPEIGGGIHRVDSKTVSADGDNGSNTVSLAQVLNQAQPEDLPNVYEQANIWYNTLSSLADLRQSRPDDPVLKQQWHDLLVEVGHEKIADAPLVGTAVILGEEEVAP